MAISKKLKERLLKQKQDMDSGGVLIPNKGFTKARIRLLPVGDDLPGHRFISYYCSSLQGEKKGSTSPATFGKPCPIEDAFDKIRRTADKDDRDAAYEFINKNTEYWVPCVVRGDEGDARKPKIRIHAAKKTVYEQIQTYFLDDDFGEDISDPENGRDLLIKKTGQGRQGTKWSCEKMDPTPIHEDEEIAEALVAAGESFDVRERFYPVDFDVLAAMYEGLTGEEMPDHYREGADEMTGSGGHDDEDEGYDDEADEDEVDEDEVEDDAEDESEDEDEGLEEGTLVSFENDGEEYEGTFLRYEEGEDGEELAIVDVEGEGEWDVEPENLTVIDAEAEDDEAEDEAEDDEAEDDEADESEDEDEGEDEGEDEDEAEEEAPTVVRRSRKPGAKKTSKKAPAKRTAKKAAKKAPARKAASKKAPAKKAAKKKTAKKPAARKAPASKKKTSKKAAGKKGSARKAASSRIRRKRGG